MTDKTLHMDEQRRASIPDPERCRFCHGTGNELYSLYRKCRACGGSGRSRGNEQKYLDEEDSERQCFKCGELANRWSRVDDNMRFKADLDGRWV